MSIATGKTHLGFQLQLEALEHDGIISANDKTISALDAIQKGVDWTIKNLRDENADLQGLLNTANEKLAQAEIQAAGKDKKA